MHSHMHIRLRSDVHSCQMWVCTQETQTTALGWGWAKSGGVSCQVFSSWQLRDKSVNWQKCRNECSKTRLMTTQCQRYKYCHRKKNTRTHTHTNTQVNLCHVAAIGDKLARGTFFAWHTFSRIRTPSAVGSILLFGTPVKYFHAIVNENEKSRQNIFCCSCSSHL